MKTYTKQDIMKIFEIDESEFNDCKNNPSKIKTLYRLASKKYHPDRGGSTEAFVKIREAYEAFLNTSYIDNYTNHYQQKASNNETNKAYDEYMRERNDSASNHEHASQVYRYYAEHCSTKTQTYKKTRSKWWYVFWPLRGLLYALSLIILNALHFIYYLAAFAASVCFIVCLFKLFIAIFDNGDWLEVINLVLYSAGLYLIIQPCDWLEGKKEDILYTVWRWWRL